MHNLGCISVDDKPNCEAVKHDGMCVLTTRGTHRGHTQGGTKVLELTTRGTINLLVFPSLRCGIPMSKPERKYGGEVIWDQIDNNYSQY